MDAAEFRANGHRLIEWIIDYHERLDALPVQSAVEPGEVAALLPERPGAPDGFDAVLADLDRVVVPGLTNWQHPGFFAWFPANTAYPAILAELVTAGLGVQGMSWASSPAVTEIETRMMDWMID
ncbi:MAG: aspartate aminotransferase family protein, partial [Micropruina sp.]|nr:aspartate aminotransferase family protein [Micropruina sp.]